jgi:hypothetical protein
MQHNSILANPICLLLLATDLFLHSLQAGKQQEHSGQRCSSSSSPESAQAQLRASPVFTSSNKYQMHTTVSMHK